MRVTFICKEKIDFEFNNTMIPFVPRDFILFAGENGGILEGKIPLEPVEEITVYFKKEIDVDKSVKKIISY